MTKAPENRSLRFSSRLAAMLTVAGIIAGCEKAKAPQTESPLVTVTVVKAEQRSVPIVAAGTGTTRAIEEVTIRARVSGFLLAKNFEEGTDVKKVEQPTIDELERKVEAGTDVSKEAVQPLLLIDERTYKAAFDAAVARRKQAKDSQAVQIAAAKKAVSDAQLYFADIQLKRSEGLLRRNAITNEEYQEKVAAFKQASADVAAKQADYDQAKVEYEANNLLTESDLQQAKLNLEYCRMYAPLDGRIGELQVRIGNYVSGTGIDGTPLVTIQQLDPMGVDLQIPSRYLPQVETLVKEGLKVNLLVQGNRPFPHQAEVYFYDNHVDPNTSTFLVRAKVPNPGKGLLPGDYVKTDAIIGEHGKMVVVPEQAVIETQAGPVVYVIDAKNQAAMVRVEPIDTYQGLRVLKSGLEPGQPVIVEGLQMVRPGQTVKVEVTSLETYLRTEPASKTATAPTPLRTEPASNTATAPTPTPSGKSQPTESGAKPEAATKDEVPAADPKPAASP